MAHKKQKRPERRLFQRWRTEGICPKYLKLCGRVLYRLVDIEE